MPRAPPGHGAGDQANHGGPANGPTQARNARVGTLAPPRGAPGHLHHSGDSHLQASGVLGHTEAPKDVWPRGGKQDVCTHNGRQGPFVGTGAGPQGHPDDLALCRAGDVPMHRQVKLTGAAHPYDPQGEGSGEERLGVKMAHPLKGRRHLRSLWQQPHGLGPVCPQQSTRRTGGHNHHGIWRTHGGRETAANRVLLRPTCPRQVQSQQ